MRVRVFTWWEQGRVLLCTVVAGDGSPRQPPNISVRPHRRAAPIKSAAAHVLQAARGAVCPAGA